MNTSGGGGYCDCGDAEAWTSDPACDMHGVISQQDQVRFPSLIGVKWSITVTSFNIVVYGYVLVKHQIDICIKEILLLIKQFD